MKIKKSVFFGIIIIVVFVIIVFILKLYQNPSVSVGGVDPFSWENIKNTAIGLFIAGIVVLFIRNIFTNSENNDKK